MIKEKRKQEIVTQAFILTGHDAPESLFEYINTLENVVLQMHKMLSKRGRSLSRINIDQAIKESSIIAVRRKQ